MLLQLFVLAVSFFSVECANPPHIVLLVADDLGWNDVSWHNPYINTTNLQRLAEAGVILNSSYVQNVCSPTRASFLTGRYPYHLGLQMGVVSKDKAEFLTTNYSTLPEKLKDSGYISHMVGKWHLGYCNWTYTPTYRGFESHRRILLAGGDHWAHTSELAVDVIKNHDASNPLFLYVAFQAPHTPLQAKAEYLDQYSGVANEERRNFSAMVTHMDVAVGQIRQALEDKGLLDNLLLVFLSDNGGELPQGNNFPLRGGKGTNLEGGVRTPAFVYSNSLLSKRSIGTVHSGMIHAVDWYATFLDIAGLSDNSGIDGVSQWNMIKSGVASNRTGFVYNINSFDNTAAIRVGDYKLIEGNLGKPDTVSAVQSSRRCTCRDVHGAEKEDDPSENTDLADTMSDKVDEMKAILETYRKSEYPVTFPPYDPNSEPKNWGGNWSPGWCEGDL